ncbi:UNVERIFIED_CONTAM: hypothetical protein HHA_277930 [Hammondia hammondi]|eukprot:XP_008887067.1 hypothetical protein HHA_277930 [Hammondia hammondi]
MEGENPPGEARETSDTSRLFSNVVYLEEAVRSPVQFLDSRTLCSLTGNALSLRDVETGQRSLVSFTRENPSQICASITLNSPHELPSGSRPEVGSEENPRAANPSRDARDSPKPEPSSVSVPRQRSDCLHGLDGRVSAFECEANTRRKAGKSTPVQLLRSFAACERQSLVACVGRGETGDPGYRNQVFLVKKESVQTRNGKERYTVKVVQCAKNKQLVTGEVCALAFSACGGKLYCLSQCLATKQEDHLETAFPSALDFESEDLSCCPHSRKEGLELIAKRGLAAAVALTVYDTATDEEIAQTEIPVSGLGRPRELSVCPGNANLVAHWSSKTLQFVQLFATGDKNEAACNVVDAIGEEANCFIVSVAWFSLSLKKCEKDLRCCCAASRTGLGFVFHLTDEKGVATPKLMWTFQTSSTVTSLLFSEPYLVTCHEDLSVLFSKCNSEFPVPFDHSQHQAAPGTHFSEVAEDRCPSLRVLRVVTAEHRKRLLLLADGFLLESSLPYVSEDSASVVPKRSSQSEANRKSSSKRAQPEGRRGEVAQLANISLQTKLLGLCSHDPLVGVIVRQVPGKESARGVEEFEVTTATSTGLIRTCSLHLPAFWENSEALRHSACLLKSQISLPARLSCIYTPEHAALGSAVLAGSEGGVLRCLSLADSELVKAIKVAEEPIRGLTVCPEVVEYHEASSLLLGALMGEDTLAFLRATGEGSSLSSSTLQNLVVLGTLALSTALGLHTQVAAGRACWADANRGRPRRNPLPLHAEADEMRVLLRKDLAWIQHPDASLATSTRWLLACGNILRLEEPPLNVLFFAAAPSRSSVPRDEDLSDTCLLHAAKLAVCPACLCVVGKGIYVGTARGEIVCFDFFQLWNAPTRHTNVDALVRSPPASPLCCIAVASSLLRNLASPSVSSTSLPPPAVSPLDADTCLLLATSLDGRVHAVRVPRLPQRENCSGGDEFSVANDVAKDAATTSEKASPSETEGRTPKNHLCRVLWTRDLCGDAGCTDLSVTSAVAFPLLQDIVFLVATSLGREGLLMWKSSLSGQESRSESSSCSAAQAPPCGLACEVHRTPPIACVQPSSSPLETRAAIRNLGTDDASVELWQPDRAVEAHVTWKETSLENAKYRQESKEAVAAEMNKIREALAVLVAENETRSSAESLPRESFCLDEEEREKIAGEAAREKQRLRQEHRLHALAFEALRDRLIEKFWKKLKRHGKVLASLAEGKPELVRDFSVSHVPAEQAKIEKKVCFLRKLEKREKAWLRNVEVTDKSLLRMKVEEPLSTPCLERMQEEYISHAWVERDSQVVYSDSGATTATEGALEQTGGFPEDDPRFQHVKELRSLLYPPLQVLSMSRRRVQSCLLNQVASALRDAFNEMFDAVAMDKKRTVEQINQRAKVASAIAAELKCAQKVATYTSPACEDPEALLKVTEEDVLAELGFVPSWLTSGERNEEGKEEESNACIDEASARALQQMMDGQLNSKKDTNVLEMKVEKESWMDEVKPEDMTETQKKKVAEFEKQVAQLAALQEAYRKKQEGNLLRVKEEIRDLRQKFQDKFKRLQDQRRQLETEILKEELYSIRHCVRVNSSIDRANSLDDLLRELSDCSRQTKRTTEEVAKVRERCEQLETQHHNAQQTEKEIVASLKTCLHHAQLPPETYNALMGIFRQKRKHSQTRLSTSRSSSSERRHEALQEDESFRGGARRSPDFPEDTPIPEGVDETLLWKVLQARQDKREAESRLSVISASLEKSRRYLSCVQQRQQQEASLEAALVKRISEARRELELMEMDVKLLIEIKQGHIEVSSPTPVSTYEDACIVHKEAIERCNEAILAIGKQKLDTLEMIKEFRRKIVMVEWEKKVLEAEARELEEKTKDVHMLRVTKEIQKYLATGADQKEENSQEGVGKEATSKTLADSTLTENSGKVSGQLHTNSEQEGAIRRNSQLDVLDKKIRELQQDIQKKTCENATLEKLASDLQQDVAYGQKIRQLREKPLGLLLRTGSLIAGKNKKTSLQYVRRLQHAARRHTDEIDELREELKRLRARTIPMFESAV